MSNSSIRRQLGGMPTGSYNMADMAFSVHRHEPKKEEPAIVTEYDLWDGSITVCAKQPFQDLEEAVERWIRMEAQRALASASVEMPSGLGREEMRQFIIDHAKS